MDTVKTYTGKLKRHPNQYFQNFIDRLTPEIVEELLGDVLDRVQAAQDLEEWEAALAYWNEVKAHIQTHFELIELAFQCHTKDQDIEKEHERLKQEVEPVFDKHNAPIREKVLGSPHKAELQNKYGEQYFIILQLEQDAFDPKNIELDTKLSKVMTDYTKLTGGASFELDGKTYPLAHYVKFSNSPDEKTRRDSFLSYSSWFLNNRDSLEEIYDRAVDLRTQMGKVLGFSDYTPLGYKKMRRTDYGPEEVAELRAQILEAVVPVAVRIREHQAKTLGKDAVGIWDSNFFPEWKVGKLKVSVPEQPATALKIYEKLSPTLGAHFKNMMDWGLIDLKARDGKGPGAFCTDFSDYRTPFIFLNSVDEGNDVTTMLHECGHSFQAWESKGIDLVELRWPTLEACEVHSMGMEFLAYPYYEEFFTPEDADKFKKRHLADTIMLLPYIAMVDEFQHKVYAGEAPGPEGRSKVWEELENKYLPGMDFSDLPAWKQHRWIRQLHIFRSPFYYIDYSIAQIGAWQLWMESLDDVDAAMQNYLNLCRLGGTLPLKQFFAAGRLDLPFKPGMLQPLIDRILAVENLFD